MILLSTTAGLASRTGSTGFAAAAAFTFLHLPANSMLVSLLSEAEAAAPGAPQTRPNSPPGASTSTFLLLASSASKDTKADADGSPANLS
jgi:hypothetical protein